MSGCRRVAPFIFIRSPFLVAIGAAALLAGGCGTSYGPPRGAVSGDVLVDGQPLAEGVITFVPTRDTKGPSAGAAIQEGHYEIPEETGPVVGDYRVEVRAQKKTGRMIEVGSPEPPGTKIAETVEALPAKYNSNSALQTAIKAGNNRLDLDLKTK